VRHPHLPRIPTASAPLLRAVVETFCHKAAEEAATHLIAIVGDEVRALIHRFKLKHNLYLDPTPQETSEDGDKKEETDQQDS